MTHEIKLKENFALPVLSGEKNFEIRYNDRGYQRGDYVKFNVIAENALSIADENLVEQMSKKLYVITYVLNGWGIENGYVVFGIKEISKDAPCETKNEEFHIGDEIRYNNTDLKAVIININENPFDEYEDYWVIFEESAYTMRIYKSNQTLWHRTGKTYPMEDLITMLGEKLTEQTEN